MNPTSEEQSTPPTILQLIQITNGYEIRRRKLEAQIGRYLDQIRELREALGLVTANPQNTQNTTSSTRNNNNDHNQDQKNTALQDLQRKLDEALAKNDRMTNDMINFSNRENLYTTPVQDDSPIQKSFTFPFTELLNWGMNIAENRFTEVNPETLGSEIKERFERVGGLQWRQALQVGSADRYRFYLIMALVIDWTRESLLEPFMCGIEDESFSFNTLLSAFRGGREEQYRWKKDTVTLLLKNEEIQPKVTARAGEIAATIVTAITPFIPVARQRPSVLRTLRRILEKLALAKLESEKEPFPITFQTYPPGTQCDPSEMTDVTYVNTLDKTTAYNKRIALTVVPSIYRELHTPVDGARQLCIAQAKVYFTDNTT
ncbi:hypothetical protein DFH27DRAFT_584212 [Peziza echinospora]|nr:hypothetical protein DFH27DRAFT_584212 [Peziza echinospora]